VGPSASEYVTAVQARAFVDEGLRAATPRPGLLGLPASATGQQAVVFPMTTADGTVAVRCFTTSPDVRRERYRLLAEHLSARPNDVLCGFRWIDAAVRAADETWPALVMPWVEGRRLDAAVEERLGSPERLVALADRIVVAHRSLRAGDLAHGDLQHGNVVVGDDDEIRLIDLDSVWTPSLAGHRPGECGHPNYQHPDRIERATWGARVDTFSVLLLSVSLRALAADRSLWRHHNGDNLIFTADDLRRPGVTPLWHDLARVATGDLATEVDAFRRLCLAPRAPDMEIDDVPGLRDAPPGSRVEGAWWAGMAAPAVAPAVAPVAGRAAARPAPLAPLAVPAGPAAPVGLADRLRRGEVSSFVAALAGTAAALAVVAIAFVLLRIV
jgi:hypothetical protein